MVIEHLLLARIVLELFHVFSNSSTPSEKFMIPTLLVGKLRLSEANNTLTSWNVNHGCTF